MGNIFSPGSSSHAPVVREIKEKRPATRPVLVIHGGAGTMSRAGWVLLARQLGYATCEKY